MARPVPAREPERLARPLGLVHGQPARKGILRRRRGRVIRFRARDVFRAGLALLLLGAAAYLLTRLHEVIFLLLLAILVATAIDPLVNRLRRGPFNRGSGVLVVYSAIVAAIGVPTAILAPSVATQGTAFLDTLPQRIEELRPYVQELQPAPLGQAMANGVDRLAAEVRGLRTPPDDKLVEVGAATLHSLLAFITVFIMAFYWLTERASLKRTLLRMVPTRHAREVNAVWVEVEDKLGGWVRGQLVLMLAVGVMAGLAFWAIGLPNPALLAVLAAVAEMIPIIGPFIAFAPALLVALTMDPSKLLLTLGAALVIQQIEGGVLVPRVMGHAVGISPLVVFVAVLAGAALYGMPGALLAVPVAGAAQVVLMHLLRLEQPEQAEAHRAAGG